MGKMLLTSYGLTTTRMEEAFLDLIERPPSDLAAAIVTTAHVKLREKAPVSIKLKEKLESLELRKIDFVDVEFDDAECLMEYDSICLSGGNPFYLLHHLRQSGADRILEKQLGSGIVLLGISAGTMVLCPDIRIVDHFTPEMNQIGVKDLTALGLYNGYIFPHYGTPNKFPHEKSHETRIQEYERTNGCHVERMTDYDALYINGDRIEKIKSDDPAQTHQ